jgi:hypothetical protein
VDDQRDEPTADDQEETRTAKGGSHSQGGEPPMKRIGDFKLLREIGRGGMGCISFMASTHDEPIRRLQIHLLGFIAGPRYQEPGERQRRYRPRGRSVRGSRR